MSRPTVMEISLENAKYNIEKIKEKLPSNTEIMPIIKAEGYGTYLNRNIDFLNMFSIVGVAIVEEGVFLRKMGYKGEIFVLNQSYKEEIPDIIENDLSIGISSDSFIKELGKEKSNVKVHIEIGTGMGRTSIKPERVEEYVSNINKYKNIKIEGTYTHLSSADCDIEYSKSQIQSFKKAIKTMKDLNLNLKYIHAFASSAILNFKEPEFNLVRPGILLYGYLPDKCFEGEIDVKPIATLKSRVTLIKTVPENFSIGYSRSFITKRKTKVATIPIGYADGYKRVLSNKGYVFINNKKAPIIGKVCMDSIMADITEIENVNTGDEVILFDDKNITVDEIAELCGTINYEILSSITARVPRVFK